MKENKIINAIGHIDDDLISEAAGEGESRRLPWIKWASLAACFIIIVTAGALTLPYLKDETEPHDSGDSGDIDTNSGSDEGIKRPVDIYVGESDIEYNWPWEYLTVSEKYPVCQFNGREYRSRGYAVDADYLSDVIGECEGVGYDSLQDEYRTETFEVRAINGVSEDHIIAVGMEGTYYVYSVDFKDVPATFGELMELYSLADTLPLSRFSERKGYTVKDYYTLDGDDYIWQVLSECGDAPLYEDYDFWTLSDVTNLAFTATSSPLGVYKRAMYITEDGYFSTNVFDYNYIYFIGEDAAAKIINYAAENSEKSEMVPYELTVSGIVTEISDGYIAVDNSILMENEEDATVYRVLTDDIRLRRFVLMGFAHVGDAVIIKARGEYDPDTGNVTGAYSYYVGQIYEGDVLIPE